MPASKTSIGSDLARVDAYRLTASDYDEIPEATAEDFARATVNKGGIPLRGRPALGDKAKKQVTLRLDPSVIAHFRKGGDGWQSRINLFLNANETVLRMISEFEESIGDMEKMLPHFHSGELRTVFENEDKALEKIESNVRTIKETVRGLKKQLHYDSKLPSE